MYPLKKIFLLSFIFCSFLSFGQERNEELLKWTETRKLSWDDYKAEPDTASDAVASTTTYLSVEYTFMTDGFRFKIESNFSKTQSWALKKTNYILKHEQGHFDIAEIYARKLYREMQQYKFNKKTYKNDLNKIYRDILEEKTKMQDDYDKETNHSINEEKQREWLKRINKMLKEYAEWSGY
jgi:predicted secreted Zn-dependent protease